jgi:hypothetical protein
MADLHTLPPAAEAAFQQARCALAAARRGSGGAHESASAASAVAAAAARQHRSQKWGANAGPGTGWGRGRRDPKKRGAQPNSAGRVGVKGSTAADSGAVIVSTPRLTPRLGPS